MELPTPMSRTKTICKMILLNRFLTGQKMKGECFLLEQFGQHIIFPRLNICLWAITIIINTEIYKNSWNRGVQTKKYPDKKILSRFCTFVAHHNWLPCSMYYHFLLQWLGLGPLYQELVHELISQLPRDSKGQSMLIRWVLSTFCIWFGMANEVDLFK